MKFYIDTVIILDYIKNRNTKSIQFLENLKDNNEWLGYTSSFTKLELVDNLQSLDHMNNLAIKENRTLDEITRKRNQRKLMKHELTSSVDNVEKFFDRFRKKINLYDLNEGGWNKALELCRLINISAKDVIHLSTALESECDFFITNDTDLIGNVKKENLIHICKPMNISGLIENNEIITNEDLNEFRGMIVEIIHSDFYKSGLIKRCQYCNNVLEKGVCSNHAKVEGCYDLVLSVIVYNGFFEKTVAFEKEDIEKYFDLSLEKAKRMTTESLDLEIVKDILEEKLKGKFCIIEFEQSKITSFRFDKSIPSYEALKFYHQWKDDTQNW